MVADTFGVISEMIEKMTLTTTHFAHEHAYLPSYNGEIARP